MSMTSETEVDAMDLDSTERAMASHRGFVRPDRPIKRKFFRRMSKMMLPSTTKAKPAVERLAHHFREPRGIPGVNGIYVYPHAQQYISSEHQIRFEVLVEIFRQNLHEHNKLSLKHPYKAEFKLRMCGKTMEDAKPSILVHHPHVKVGALILRILDDSPVKEQYDDSSPMRPCYGLYLVLGPAWKYFGCSTKDLHVRMTNSRIAGALLVSGEDGISTITCGIRFPGIDGTIFALTTAHAFEEDDEYEAEATEYDEEALDALLVPSEVEGQDRKVYRLAGVEYDMVELMKCENMSEQYQISQTSIHDANPSGHVQGYVDEATTTISPNRVWGRPKAPKWDNHSNLDWALVEIEQSPQWETGRVDLAMSIFNSLDGKNRDVRIITSRGTLYGEISTIPTFIANSNTSSSLCKVWTVTIPDPSTQPACCFKYLC